MISMARINAFEDIQVWRDARRLVSDIYRMTEVPPLSRDYGLKDQLRRSSISVMANIAEGFERNGSREFIQFLSLAKGSAGELRSHLYIASDLGAISGTDQEQLKKQVVSISRQLSGLIKYVLNSSSKGSKYHKLEM